MKLSFVGLGYVGLVSSICLAAKKHKIFGYDKDFSKIEFLKSKELYINEKNLNELFIENFNRFQFSNALDDNLYDSDLVFVCVDTPYDSKNVLNLSNLYNAIEEIADNKKNKSALTILIRSTIPPGTIEHFNVKYKEKNLMFISNPEFLREGNAVEDFYEGDVTVIGGDNKLGIELCKKLYNGFRSKKIITSSKNAELIKFVNNSFHALKITFANEIGQICSSLNVDSNELMDIFKSDKQLNISEKYLSPGFAYGGSCLPKDTNGLKNLAQSLSLKVPLIESIEKSNNELITKAGDIINSLNPRNILIIGISFKKGTDDLRGSPMIELANVINHNKFHFIDHKINIKEFESDGSKFYKSENTIDLKSFDTIIFNHYSNDLDSLINLYNCKNILDVSNSLKKKENIITIT